MVYDPRLSASLQGGVRQDIANSIDFTDDIRQAQAAAMSAEDQRRRLAASRPGHGSQLHLPQPPAAAGVGISDVPMPVVGLGYESAPEPSEAVSAVYVMPSYAPDVVGGYGFQAGRSEPAIRVFRSAGLSDVLSAVSPPPRPGLWARLRDALRRPR